MLEGGFVFTTLAPVRTCVWEISVAERGGGRQKENIALLQPLGLVECRPESTGKLAAIKSGKFPFG